MYSGGDPGSLAASIAAIAIPAATTMGSTIATLASQPDSPETPKIADANKEVLGSWAKRMATEENNLENNDSFLLRPGGSRITFQPQINNRLPQNKFLLT